MKNIIPYIISLVLAILLYDSYTSKKEVVVERLVVDTVEIEKFDTVYEKIPTFITETIIDTIFIKSNENGLIQLEKTQRLYSGEKYKAWVSGYKPILDSIEVYDKIVEKTITNTVTRDIYKNTTDFYITAGGKFNSGNFYPEIGLSLKTKSGMIIGGNVGYFNGDVCYGINIGFKLNNRNNGK